MRDRPDRVSAFTPAGARSATLDYRAIVLSPLTHLQLLLVTALVLGGGGVSHGLRNLAVQLLAIAILAFHSGLVQRFVREAPKPLVLLVGLSMAVPLLQLVPLPADIWQGLPGRNLVADSLAIAGLGADRWFPASVGPMRTLVAFAGTLAPATVIVIGSALPREDRLRLAWTVIWASLTAFLLGALQVGSNHTIGTMFAEPFTAEVLYATFANRNSTALLFVLSLCLIAGLPIPASRVLRFVGGAAAVLLVIGVILSQSRSGMALLVVPIGLMAFRALIALFGRRPDDATTRSAIWIGVVLAAVMALAVGYSALSGGRVADSFSRFSDTQTDRPEMWEDGLYAAGQYWPLGSGVGTTDDVFQIHESLEYVSPRRAGRVHNDFIEAAIEGGIVSLGLAALWLVWCAFAALRPGALPGWWLRLGAGAGIAAIALQSLLDYPLRNQALLCVAAVLVVLLAREQRVKR